MTTQHDEAVRMIYVRRLLDVQREYDLPRLSRADTIKLSTACCHVKGDGLTDPDLRRLSALTSRGFFT